MVRFPPNSGDLSPIENVWAKLRLDLAELEMIDFQITLPIAIQGQSRQCVEVLYQAKAWSAVQLPDQARAWYAEAFGKMPTQ